MAILLMKIYIEINEPNLIGNRVIRFAQSMRGNSYQYLIAMLGQIICLLYDNSIIAFWFLK